MLSKEFLEQVMNEVKPIIKREVDEYALVVIDSLTGQGKPSFDGAIRYRVTDNYNTQYLERAISKARFTWRTGLPSSMGKVFPELKVIGDNSDSGSVCVGEITVALTARIDPLRVEQLAYLVAYKLHAQLTR